MDLIDWAIAQSVTLLPGATAVRGACARGLSRCAAGDRTICAIGARDG
jgi:hypothetical protein